MGMRLEKFLLCICSALVFLTACDKGDDNGDDLMYLSGSLSFVKAVPEYVGYGYEQDMTVTGVHHPDASRKPDGTYTDTLGYSFTNPFTEKKDTVKRFEDPVDTKVTYHLKVVKDTLASFTLTASAYAPGYYPSTCSSSFTVVRPGYGDDRSLRGFKMDTDTVRVGQRFYYKIRIGDTEWMRQNYADDSDKAVGRAYKDCEIMNDVFGRYYTWTEAQSICPKGWRLPTSAELDALVDSFGGVGALMADIYFNGSKAADKMWTYWPAVGTLTDASRLSVIPTGYALISDGKYTFFDLKSRAVIWTSDEEAGKGVTRYIFEDQNKLFKGSFDKDSFAASVRCVRDSEPE